MKRTLKNIGFALLLVFVILIGFAISNPIIKLPLYDIDYGILGGVFTGSLITGFFNTKK